MVKEKDLFLGKDIEISKCITIHNPKIKEILEFGEEKYFILLGKLIGTPLDFKEALHDIGIDYKIMSDFMFFSLIIRGLKMEDTKIIFGNVDLSKFELAQNNYTKDYVLYDEENEAIIDYIAYVMIIDCLRKMYCIEKDSRYLDFSKNQNKQYESLLLSWVTECPAYMNLTFFAFFNLIKSGALPGV